MGHPAIKISGLGFSYPKNPGMLFSDLNLEVADGESFGIFGPNGAGKTSLMGLMTGLLPYQYGSIEMLGQKVTPGNRSVNKLFGLVPQDFSMYEELNPEENLAFFGAWAGLNSRQVKQRTEELLEIMHLTQVKNKPVHTFSGGMKRRVNLAIGVIHNPHILFLDEPTVGVDVQSRHDIMTYLKQLNEAGTTLIYTSHQLAEAESLCKKVAMIDDGQIVAHDDLNVLLEHHEQDGLEGLFLQLTGKKFED